MVQEFKDFWTWVQTDTTMKYLFMIITGLILIFFNYAWIKTFLFRKREPLVIEAPISKPIDTLKESYETKSRVENKISTPKSKKKEKQSIMQENKKEKDTLPKEKSSFDLSHATFNAPAQIGNNNIQNNQYDLPKQRVIQESEIDVFVNKYTDRNVPIQFIIINTFTQEALNVKNKIIEMLTKKGYTNIDKETHDATIFPEPEPFITDFINNGIVTIEIAPLR